MNPRQGDTCPECGGEWLVMVAKFDHRMSCSEFPADLRRRIERTRERVARERARKTTAAQTTPGRGSNLPSSRPGAVVQDLITGEMSYEDQDRMDRDLRGGMVSGVHLWDCPCDGCENGRRRALVRYDRTLHNVGLSPKNEEAI